MKNKIYKISTDQPVERVDGMQKVILDLTFARRQPTNEQERILLKQIQDIKAKGRMLDLPFD